MNLPLLRLYIEDLYDQSEDKRGFSLVKYTWKISQRYTARCDFTYVYMYYEFKMDIRAMLFVFQKKPQQVRQRSLSQQTFQKVPQRQVCRKDYNYFSARAAITGKVFVCLWADFIALSTCSTWHVQQIIIACGLNVTRSFHDYIL